MKVKADLTVCKAYANCVMEAPDVFDISDETGLVEVLVEEPGPELEEDVRRAVAACPSGALSIEE